MINTNRGFHKLFFTEKLHKRHRSELEKIFFFNQNQQKYWTEIEKKVKEFGEISIKEDKECVFLLFNDSLVYNSLYVLDSEKDDAGLIGVVVYSIYMDCGIIIHIAIDSLCSIGGFLSKEIVTLRILEKVRKILKIKNIPRMKIPYKDITINTDNRLINLLD